jgi:5-methylcytosine-specific restriction endonuclease McrA
MRRHVRYRRRIRRKPREGRSVVSLPERSQTSSQQTGEQRGNPRTPADKGSRACTCGNRKRRDVRRQRGWNMAKRNRNREADAERTRAWRARIRADPVLYAQHLEKLRARKKKYYAAHKEQERAAKRRDYRKHREKRLADAKERTQQPHVRAQKKKQQHDWYARNCERLNRKSRERYFANHEAEIAYRKRTYSTAKRSDQYKKYKSEHPDRVRASLAAWYEKNKDRHKARMDAYFKAHPGYRSASSRTRQARMRAARIGSWQEIKAYYHHVRTADIIHCHYCKNPVPKDKRHVDHVTPIIRGGAHAVSNFVPSCARCNLRKNRKLPHEFKP